MVLGLSDSDWYLHLLLPWFQAFGLGLELVAGR
jgi:hypothetical protein